jgi:dienelactone hydrolase
MKKDSFDNKRRALLSELEALLADRRRECDRARKEFFSPNTSSPTAYAASLAKYRRCLVRLLGWPLTDGFKKSGAAVVEAIAEDDLGRIFQVSLPVIGSLRSGGLFFLPAKSGRHPAIIAQHGGGGSPETASGLGGAGTANYNGLITGLRQRGVAVFAPQLFVWGDGQEPKLDQNLLDRRFRQLGGSRAALDLLQLKRVFDWMSGHEEIDRSRIGMAGLSYGGFYALFFGALEPRLRLVVSSCFVNDRYRYNWEDWVWTGSAMRFLDSEVGRMICPRPLFLEAGRNDELFDAAGFSPVAKEIATAYKSLGIADRFESRIHRGAHDYDPDGRGGAFILKWLS